jgi:N-acetyl-anhydromuramyl-L-alanine amidase AmpD
MQQQRRVVEMDRGVTSFDRMLRPASGISDRWRYIVLHHSATRTGGAVRFDKMHVQKNGWDELGYHFVIGNGSDTRDGQIEIGPRWTKQKHGAHCKTPDNRYNDHGIGICLVGDFENGGAPSKAQRRQLFRLVESLSRQCRVPLGNIRTHGDITHRTACPGRNFSLAPLRNELRHSGSIQQASR